MSTICQPCPSLDCVFPADLELYGLQGPNGPWTWLKVNYGGYPFDPNTGKVKVPVTCPPGYFCPRGTVGGFEWIDPNLIPRVVGGYFPVRVRCCDGSYVTAQFSNRLTPVQNAAIATALFNAVAQKQAYCDRVAKLNANNTPQPSRFSNFPPKTLFLQHIGGSDSNDAYACLASSFTFTIPCIGKTPPPYVINVVGGNVPPNGFVVTTADGTALIISGTPTKPGVYKFTVRATDKSVPKQIDQQQYSISVLGLTSGILSNGVIILPSADACKPYNQQLAASGGTAPFTYSYNSDITPNWFFMTSTGLIFGTPTQGDNGVIFNFPITLTDADGHSCIQDLRIAVTAMTCPTIGAAYNGILGQFYFFPIPLPTFGTGPYTYTWNGGGTDPTNIGLFIIPGAIVGTPTATGNFVFGIRITDSIGCNCTAGVTLHVAPMGSVATTVICPSNPFISVGVPAGQYTSGGGPGDPDQNSLNALASMDAFNKLAPAGCPFCNAQVTIIPRVNSTIASPNSPGNVSDADVACPESVVVNGSGVFNQLVPLSGHIMWGGHFGLLNLMIGSDPAGLYTFRDSTGTHLLWTMYF